MLTTYYFRDDYDHNRNIGDNRTKLVGCNHSYIYCDNSDLRYFIFDYLLDFDDWWNKYFFLYSISTLWRLLLFLLVIFRYISYYYSLDLRFLFKNTARFFYIFIISFHLIICLPFIGFLKKLDDLND